MLLDASTGGREEEIPRNSSPCSVATSENITIQNQVKELPRQQDTKTGYVCICAKANLVAAVEDVDHALRVRVPLVARVRGAVVDHGLIDGVRGLVGEDARRQAGYQLHHLVDSAALHDVVVDDDVLAEELHLVLEVAEQAPDLIGCGEKRAKRGEPWRCSRGPQTVTLTTFSRWCESNPDRES